MTVGESGAAAPSRLSRSEWLLLLVLGAVQFTHIVDFVILLPLGPELQGALRVTPREFGWVVAAYGFSASLSGLLAAWFLDGFDRKRALLVLYGGFTLGTFLCAVAPSFGVLVLGRTVAGGFAGVMSANVLAIVGDAFPESRRGTAMGVVMSAFSVASIVGVPAGVFLANQASWRTPFACLGVLSVAVFGLAWAALPPLRGHLRRTAGPAVGPLQVLGNRAHLRAYALTTALTMGSFTIVPYLATYLVNNVGRDKSELPYVWLCGGIATLLTMTPVGRLSDRHGKLRVFRVVALLALIPTLLVTNLPSLPLALTLAATTLFMIGTAGRMVPAMAMITASALPRYRGSFMSINASVQQMAMGLAPLVSGFVLGDTAEGVPLQGFSTVGLVSVSAMLASVILAGGLRPAAAKSSSRVPEPAEPSLAAVAEP
jgi:predicted MFS family arabinose efflux permease